MRFAFYLTTAVYAGLVVAAAFLLPDRVALHFDGSGQPDRWGSRTEALLSFAAMGGGTALLLGGLAAWSVRIPLSSPMVNLPHKDWWTTTPEREAEARRRLRTDLYGFSAAMMVLLSAVLVVTVVEARSDEPSLGWPFMAATAVFVVGVLAWAGWVTFVRYRPEEDA